MNEKTKEKAKTKSKTAETPKEQSEANKVVSATDDTAVANKTAQAEQTVYRVGKESGIIEAVSKDEATGEMKPMHSENVINNFFLKERVLQSKTHYYSTNRNKLTKFEKEPVGEEKAQGDISQASESETPSEATETPATDTPELEYVPDEGANQVQIEVGSFVSNGQRWGEVVNKDGKMKVSFIHEGNGKLTTVNLTNEYKPMTEEEVKTKQDALALALKEDTKEIVKVLSDDEKTEFSRLEGLIDVEKEKLESAPMNIAKHLAVIYENEWWRVDYDSFTNYIIGRFGFTKEYGYRLTQIGEYLHVAAGVLGGELLSVNATGQLAIGTNKLKESLGLSDAEFNELKPVITNALTLLIDTAPKDKDGKKVITQRVVAKFNETLSDVLTTGTIEVEGKAMRVSEAKKKGVLGTAFRENYIAATAESIKTNEQLIVDRFNKSYADNNKPVVKPLPSVQTDGKFYTGKVPTLQIKCSMHDVQPIESIGNGTFQTKCQCRFRISAVSGRLECFEVGGKQVKVTN